MAFFDRLEKIQNAPVGKRRIVFLITLVAFMIIIVGVWINQLRMTLGTKNVSETANITGDQPLYILWSSVQGAFSSLQNAFDEKMKNYEQSQ